LESLKQGEQKTRLFNRFENRYQWPLAPACFSFDRIGNTRRRLEGIVKRFLLIMMFFRARGGASIRSAVKEGNRLFWKGIIRGSEKVTTTL